MMAWPALSAHGVEYQYIDRRDDPFVPTYMIQRKNQLPTKSVNPQPVSRRYVLQGIWKASGGSWKAMIAPRPDETIDEAIIEQAARTVAVGDSLQSGLKVVAIEERSVWVVESIVLDDGRTFSKKSRISFDEED